MALSGPNIDIEQDNTSSGETFTTGQILYFKDVKPTYQSSDTSDSTNKERLKTLLLSWGFSFVNVLGITKWKIATQYTNEGPRLEWQGNLYVSVSGLHVLKCKNKDKTNYQLCNDLQSDGTILLNTHASGYGNADWKWIHISEFGFGMDKNIAFQWNNNTWNYNKLYTPNKWVLMNLEKIDSNNAEMDFNFDDVEDITIPDNLRDYIIKSTMLNKEVGGFATIPRYYINNNGTLEAFKGFSFKYLRDSQMSDGYFGIENLIIENTLNSKMKYYGMDTGYAPILLCTNENIYSKDLDNYWWGVQLHSNSLKLQEQHGSSVTTKTWNYDPQKDFVIVYVRHAGVFKLTNGVPLALNYYSDVAINKDKIGNAGYLTLSNKAYDEGPIGCTLYDALNGISTSGELQYNIINSDTAKQTYDSNMFIYQLKQPSNNVSTVSWTSYGVLYDGSYNSAWGSINASTLFVNGIDKNLELIKSIIKTKTEEITLPTIKNIADNQTQSALFDKNKHYIKLGLADSSKDGGVGRMSYGIKTQLTVKNFPYIDLPNYPCSMSSDYGSGTDLKVAGDCYGYTNSARTASNLITGFEMICKGSLKNTYPGTYPSEINLIKTSSMEAYDGKWTCEFWSTNKSSVLENINEGWINPGIRWKHQSGNGVRESISWHLSIGYENEDAENKDTRKENCAFYLVLWKKIEMN